MTAPVIEVDSGKLRGITQDNVNGGTFVAFKGIPYAAPPVGNLRFSDPEPVEPWTGIRDASKFGDKCFQYDKYQQKFVGSEDCLYLNVYVPSLDPPKLRAVMVWIHGGGFTDGSSDDDIYSADYLIKKDVAVVTINYRVGCLGFLNLEHKVAPGNQGLKDQVFALKWVQKNIRKFGGDPGNVTIFGESAGAAAVHFLTLSPMARGLFHKAILQSGVVVNPWATLPVPPRQIALRLSATLGNELSNPQEVVAYLRTVDVNQLIEAQRDFFTREEIEKLMFPFVPCNDSVSDNPFLPMSIEDAVKLGIQVPCIIGYNSHEGLALMGVFESLIGKSGDSIVHKTARDEFTRKNLPVERVLEYYGGLTISRENLRGMVTLMGDTYFVAGVHGVLDVQRVTSQFPTYVYKFAFKSRTTPVKLKLRADYEETVHGEDLCFLFHNKVIERLGLRPLCKDATHHRVIQLFTEMWTNFAKTGNPTPEASNLIPVSWEPLDKGKSSEYNYLEITDSVRMAAENNYYEELTQRI